MIPSEHSVIETDLLRTFVAVCETGSFAAASKRIFRTPSAVSMQMKRLEDLLGQALFEKSGRSITLNRQGEILLGYGRQILRLNQETVSRFRVSPLEGRVRFGAPDDFGIRFLPNILARFSDTHPDVAVDVVLGASIDLLARLEAHELDLALITTAVDYGETCEPIIVHSEPLVWFGLKGGTAQRRKPVPLALSGPGCAWRASALGALDRDGVSYRVSYTSDTCQGQIAALLADLAVAPLPASLAGPELQRLGPDDGLPDLGIFHIGLVGTPEAGEVGRILATHVVDSFGEMVPTHGMSLRNRSAGGRLPRTGP